MGRDKSVDAHITLIMRLVEGYGEARSKAATHRERAHAAKASGNLAEYDAELRLSDEQLGRSARAHQLIKRNVRNAIINL